MTSHQGTATVYPASHADTTDLVELHLLLPAYQFSALEEVADRSELTVAALLRRTIGDFLGQPPATAGWQGG